MGFGNEVDLFSKEGQKLQRRERRKERQRLKKARLEKEHQESDQQLRRRLGEHPELPRWPWQALRLGWNGKPLPNKKLYIVVPDSKLDDVEYQKGIWSTNEIDTGSVPMDDFKQLFYGILSDDFVWRGHDYWISAFGRKLHARRYARECGRSGETCYLAKVALVGQDMVVYHAKDLLEAFPADDHPQVKDNDIEYGLAEHRYLISTGYQSQLLSRLSLRNR